MCMSSEYIYISFQSCKALFETPYISNIYFRAIMGAVFRAALISKKFVHPNASWNHQCKGANSCGWGVMIIRVCILLLLLLLLTARALFAS
jgi:hypothetical protein